MVLILVFPTYYLKSVQLNQEKRNTVMLLEITEVENKRTKFTTYCISILDITYMHV